MATENMFKNEISMIDSDDIVVASAAASLNDVDYVNNFTIVDVNNSTLITSKPIVFSTSYDLITVSSPDPDNALSSSRTLMDALLGAYNDNGQWQGYYNVDWDTTSIWHEMTNFQNSTAKRFFAIWGYFKGKGPRPERLSTKEQNPDTSDWTPLGQVVYQYKDDYFIDPANKNTWGGKSTYSEAIAVEGVKKYLCGSLLKPEDIRTYYRIPRYKVQEASDDIANAWQLTGYSKPNLTETEGLLKRVYQSSITETMYDAVRMQEALPVEEYDTSSDTTAIVSSADILKLFLNNTANAGCKDWARSTSNGGGRNASSGAITNIANNGGYTVTITDKGEVQFT